MMKITPSVRLATMLLILAAVLAAGRYGPLHNYVQAVKAVTPSAIAFGKGEDAFGTQDLKEWIEKEAPRRRIAPVNAVIDRVWKAIPGYNGREVDVDATYAQAKALGLKAGGNPDNFPWIYREIAPAVQLADLPVAPIYRGNPNKPMVGLMINVAWGDEYLASMLDTLDKEKVKATFFLDGTWLSSHVAMAQEISRRGHELSNHAYTHKNMSQIGSQAQRTEISRTEAILQAKLGLKNRWFAPPSGDFNGSTVRIANDLGLKTVLWTLDTVDWRLPPASMVVAKVSARVTPGTLILMHPTKTSQEALKGIIQAIRAKGLIPGTVSETLSPERVESAKWRGPVKRTVQ